MSRNIFRRYEAFLEDGGQHFLCYEIRQVNCREKEPTLKFWTDASFIWDSCYSKGNNNKTILCLGHWSTNKQDKNYVCMHISHVTALVAHLQPLTMETWGFISNSPLSIHSHRKWAHQRLPLHQDMVSHKLHVHSLAFIVPLCTAALSYRKPASAKITWRNEMFKKKKK